MNRFKVAFYVDGKYKIMDIKYKGNHVFINGVKSSKRNLMKAPLVYNFPLYFIKSKKTLEILSQYEITIHYGNDYIIGRNWEVFKRAIL